MTTIRSANGQDGQPVRDQHGRPALGELLQDLLNRLLALQVHLAGGFVEDGGWPDRGGWPAPRRSAAAARRTGGLPQGAGRGLVSVGQFLFDEAVGMGLLGSLDHLFTRVASGAP